MIIPSFLLNTLFRILTGGGVFSIKHEIAADSLSRVDGSPADHRLQINGCGPTCGSHPCSRCGPERLWASN